MSSKCECLSEFMKAQMDIISKHIDEHKYLRHMDDKQQALQSFIEDYGWLIRELYCTKICGKKDTCEIAEQLSSSGDLLRNHIK